MVRTTLTLILSISLMIVSGCADSGDTSNKQTSASSNTASDSQPSLNEAVAKIIELRNQIRDGFAAEDVDAAHGPLHEVGDVLTSLEQISGNSELTDEQQATLSTATEDLLDAFGAVDKTLHGGDGSTYEEEAQKIDSAILILAQIAGVEAGAVTTDSAKDGGKDESNDAPETIDAAEPIEISEPTEVVEPVESAEPVEVKEPADSTPLE